MIKYLVLALMLPGCVSLEPIGNHTDRIDSLRVGDTVNQLKYTIGVSASYTDCKQYIINDECTLYYYVTGGDYAFTVSGGYIIGIVKI